jgi:hypothetical protein
VCTSLHIPRVDKLRDRDNGPCRGNGHESGDAPRDMDSLACRNVVHPHVKNTTYMYVYIYIYTSVYIYYMYVCMYVLCMYPWTSLMGA